MFDHVAATSANVDTSPMTETLPNAGADHNLPVFSVSEISQALKSTVEETFAWVRVRGEVSGFKRAASGHLYLALKDEDAVLDGVCWRGTAGRLGVSPEDGMEVIVTGRLTTYVGRSKYQIVIESMEIAGEGALLKLLEDRKKKLAAEGLFGDERKQPIPFLPQVIGVITSPTGAVIRDILHRLSDRFPVRVLLWPVLVQGNEAANQISAAIDGFNRLSKGGSIPRPDLLIVARGGGSIEDLWSFNEENVVRAAANSDIPLISAVGHETDFTLIDFVADLRAPTPTAAAEMSVPVRLDLLAQVMDDGTRIISAINRLLADRDQKLIGLVRGLPNLGRLTEDSAQRLDDWSERLANSLRSGLERRTALLAGLEARLPLPKGQLAIAESKLNSESRALRNASLVAISQASHRFSRFADLLESCSYARVLERGFALASSADGRLVSSAKSIKPGNDLSLTFHDGDAGVTVNRIDANARGVKRSSRRSASTKKSAIKKEDRQGKLL
jgi:exodeoxyribonuclease VII large subunit